MFPPEQNQLFSLLGRGYRVGEHPRFAGFPYGQEGRQGTVYKIVRSEDEETFALKVFRPSFRYPTIVKKAEILGNFSHLPGLKICARTVIQPQESRELLGAYPELLYAVQMPWIDADTWSDILTAREELPLEQSIRIAESFIEIMIALEENGLAHTDLSSSNVMIGDLASGSSVQLVDLEDLYMSKLEEPDDLPDGVDGYRPPFMIQQEWQWGPYADRFAGGILVAEMLTWPDPEIREKCWGESYFSPEELQKNGERQALMIRTLERLYGGPVSGLFERLWNAEQPQQCPSFAEWSVMLAAGLEQVALQALVSAEKEEDSTVAIEDNAASSFLHEETDENLPKTSLEQMPDEEMENMLHRARSLEKQGKMPAALWEYGRLIDMLQRGSSLHREIEMVMTQIQETIDVPEDERNTGVEKIRQRYKASTQEGTNLYAKLWIILLGLSFVILFIAVLLYLI